MNYDPIIKQLNGIIPFIPTPFISNGEFFTKVHEGGLRTNLRFLAQFPFSCVSPVAGTGDLMTLDDEEYKTVLRVAMEEIGDRFLILPGLPQETERAIRMARFAESIGYNCLLSFPGPTLNMSEAGLIAHWKAIAGSIEIPIVIFRAPWVLYSMDVLKKLQDIPNIIAVKEETGDLMWFKNAKIKYGDRYTFIGGGELQFVNYLLAGAKAITTGLPNFMPKPFFGMFNHAMENNYAQAEELHVKLLPFLAVRQKLGNPIPLLKYAMDQVGLFGGVNRLPQIDLCDEDKEKVTEYLAEYKAIDFI